jgi:CO/xanthine dehydrogenase Mo-binding subunit
MVALKTVGHPASRVDAMQRVTGKATYTGDLHLPGMLYARVLRSPYPHARIRRIDASKALALAGVKAVLTHENCDVIAAIPRTSATCSIIRCDLRAMR